MWVLSLEIISAGVKLDFTIIDAKAHLFTDGGITVNSFCTRSGHIYSPMLRRIYLFNLKQFRRFCYI